MAKKTKTKTFNSLTFKVPMDAEEFYQRHNLNIHAAHGEVTGKPTMSALQNKINAAIQGDVRFDNGKRGYQQNELNSRYYDAPWCCDILVPNDDGAMEAVVRGSDGMLYRIGFTWDGENVTLSDGVATQTETTTVYAKAIEEHEKAVVQAVAEEPEDVINAAGAGVGHPFYGNQWTGGGAAAITEPGQRIVTTAYRQTSGSSKQYSYTGAKVYEAYHHKESDELRARPVYEHGPDRRSETLSKLDAMEHAKKQDIPFHEGIRQGFVFKKGYAAGKSEELEKASSKVYNKGSSETESDNIIHCRNSGVVLAEATVKKWSVDEPVEFQWMPGGITTIEASWNSRPIRLTVECDEDAASSVQASFEEWKEKYPKQEPFGCIEHREEEASIRPDNFAWKDDPEPGVYCTARPTALGARNVNGKIHRSWSPSFRTDACYSEAKCGSCRKAINACKCGTEAFVTFPDGVKGSKTNPAKITGVDFSVGSLTNKPAFKNILPVRAKQAQTTPQPETKNAGEEGLKMKVKFIKARGTNAAGSYGELDGDDLVKALNSGEVMHEDQAKAIEANEARIKQFETDQKKKNENEVVKAVERAVKRGAVLPKGDGATAETAVKAAHIAMLGKNEPEVIVQLLDHLPALVDLDKLTNRSMSRVLDEADGGTVLAGDRAEYGNQTVQEVCMRVVKAREPMHKLLPREGATPDAIKAATLISRETCALLKAHVLPGFNRGDFALRDVIHATNSDTVDPNSQVGTLSSTLILMRNLGFLKNKLSFLPYISTDMRAEPVNFGQNAQTRYITPPNVLTYVPGTGYTSDVTTINNYIASRGTNKAAVGPAATALAANVTGTLTPSVPGATDVNVMINNHLATEIVFPTSTLGGTVRNLFAEQQGAQMYSLAEIVNQVFLATMFSATWSGVSTTPLALGGNAFGLPGVIKIKTKFTINKMPDTGRFVLLHSIYHDQILTDSNLLSAKAILALIKKDAGSFEDGELPVLFGVRVLESQLAAYNSAVGTTVSNSMLGLVQPSDPATIGALTTAVGFAGNSASACFVARIPNDYTTVMKDIPATAAMEIVTEPDSGLSILFAKYVNHQLASVSARAALMFGFSQGDPRQGFLLAP